MVTYYLPTGCNMSRQIHSCRKFVGFSQKDFRGKYKKKNYFAKMQLAKILILYSMKVKKISISLRTLHFTIFDAQILFRQNLTEEKILPHAP